MRQLLFDSGPDWSYISSKLVQKVGPKWVASEFLSCSVFGADVGSGETEGEYVSSGYAGNQV